MAAHIRTQIRNKVVTALTGLATAGANVFAGRWHSVEEDRLPCYFVRLTIEQRINDEFPRPRNQTIRARLTVLAVAKETNTQTVDEVLDQMNLEARVALAAPAVIDGVGKMIDYDGIDEDGEDVDNLDIEAMSLNFAVEYITPENAPDVPR
jgi:hypothetical protein